MHPSYFNREYLSHLILILIPLRRGFYFSEDMLSDVVHTEDVAYRRTKPWCQTVLAQNPYVVVAIYSLLLSNVSIVIWAVVGISPRIKSFWLNSTIRYNVLLYICTTALITIDPSR